MNEKGKYNELFILRTNGTKVERGCTGPICGDGTFSVGK